MHVSLRLFETLVQVVFCIVVKCHGQAFAMAYVSCFMVNPVSIFGASSVKCACSVNVMSFCISLSLGVCILQDFETCSAAGFLLSLYVDD